MQPPDPRLSRLILAFTIAITSLIGRNQVFGASENVLYNFGSFATDGTLPQSGLLIDAKGNLYGTSAFGGSFVSPGASAVEQPSN